MGKEYKNIIGLILGEIYKTQRMINPEKCSASDRDIFALRNGFETVIDQKIRDIGFIPDQHFLKVAEVLDKYSSDDDKLKELKGYYDIESELESYGISRTEALFIITYFYAGGQFTRVIDKFDSEWSPAECREFPLDIWD